MVWGIFFFGLKWLINTEKTGENGHPSYYTCFSRIDPTQILVWFIPADNRQIKLMKGREKTIAETVASVFCCFVKTTYLKNTLSTADII